MAFTKYQGYGLLTALTVIVPDQITKMLVLAHIREPVAVTPFFNLVQVHNRGISFGLFNGDHDMGRWLLTGMALAISACLLVWLWKIRKMPMAVALGAVIGGALGNVIDRVRFGAVIDFLDFHALGWHWPAFNVADSAIVLGIAFIVVDGLFFDPDTKKSTSVP